MTKHDDDLRNKAQKHIEAVPQPVPENGPFKLEVVPPAEKLHIPGRVTRSEMAIILRAVTYQLARTADFDDDTTEKAGQALVAICKTYLIQEREHRKEQQ